MELGLADCKEIVAVLLGIASPDLGSFLSLVIKREHGMIEACDARR